MKGSAWAVIVALHLLIAVVSAAQPDAIKGENEQVNYSLGYQMGTELRGQSIELNPEVLMRGIQDGVSGAHPAMTPEETSRTLFELRRRVAAQRQKESQESARENLERAKAFLAENAKRKGVIVRPSGLQYRIIEEGDGKMPTPTDMVSVHYRGTFIDGPEFDNSYLRGQPAQFTVNAVIQGWTEALPLMKEGGKWELFIPPELAYGVQGMGSLVPPNSLLRFEIELISVAARDYD